MEKHQILRPSRLKGTPFLKLYYKSGAYLVVFSLVCGFSYNYLRSDSMLFLIKSGYYQESEENIKRKSSMSFMTLGYLGKPDQLELDTVDETRISSISGKPISLVEASTDVPFN